ncbi:excisionase family DNA-binding protein [Clostridium intestinale]|uniref:DNA binding domain-containing protein, excisionase family n=1 Tax=Clostridium intestinale DSM 6191 TaxID=1121320 RepID=A0A1M6ALE4_9CLOT|nr:excisionase family DNA-binding protein [Clostridium intestinale]SHI37286.1 DNA binding domain-containing protein, excisionase family [Clostridium intestinale DSM 6191]
MEESKNESIFNSEVAEILSVWKDNVVREIKKNRIKTFRVGRDWGIHESRLIEYMDVVEINT